jgi:HAD superfamily hydrolase (TIGR01509 family)
MIKAVIFDIDGVLLDSHQANFRWYKDFFGQMGKRFVDFGEYKNKYFSQPVKEVIRNLMKLEGQSLEEMYNRARAFDYSPYERLIKLPNREKEVIAALAKKYRLAIVTGRYALGSAFSITGLRPYFEVAVKFGDYQKPKPDPEPLKLALKKLNLDPQEAIYIGDSQDDLHAAQAAQIKFIAFYGFSQKIFKDADANIKNFFQLPAAIKKLSGSI